MIFGKTKAERQEAQRKRQRREGSEHLWFAWFPVEIQDGRLAWLRRVKRIKWCYAPSVWTYRA